MATVGTIDILTRMNVSSVTAGASKAASAVAGMAKSIAGSIKSLGSSIVPVVDVGSAISGIKNLALSQSKYIDDSAKLSDRLGVTTEALVGFQHAADLAGVSTEESASILEKFQKNLGVTADDGGKLRDTLSGIGLDVNKLSSKDPVEAALDVADAMRTIPDPTRRAGVAFEVFGKSGQRLTNTMLAGKAGIREAMKEAADLGMTFSRLDAAKVEAANDAFTRLSGAVAGIGRTITIGVAPFIEALIKQMTAFAATTGQSFGKLLVDGLISAVDAAQTLYESFLRIGVKLGEIMAQIGLMMNKVGNSGAAQAVGLGDLRGMGMDVANAGNAMALQSRVAANTAAAAPRWSEGIIKASTESAMAAIKANTPDLADKLFGQINTWTMQGKKIGGALVDGVMDAAKAAKAKWEGIGKQIKESVETPLEAFERKQKEIDAARKGGYITEEEARRAGLANKTSLESAVGSQAQAQTAQATIFGSKSMFDKLAAVQTQGRTSGGKSLPDLIKVAKDQQKDTARAADANEEQLKIWRNLQAVTI